MKRRSDCHCDCHTPGTYMMHIAACCHPDLDETDPDLLESTVNSDD